MMTQSEGTNKAVSRKHIPVMIDEVLAAMRPKGGESYIDGTFGQGGYSRALLAAASCDVIGIDRDPAAKEAAESLMQEFGERLRFFPGTFGDVRNLVTGSFDGFVLDIGVSSLQVDEAARGFSFRFDGPLDMRMDPRAPVTAADIVNNYDEGALADLIYHYGEERYSRRIAARIVKARHEAPITRTLQLAEIVSAAVPGAGREKIHPATRTFQALRIAVNEELDELTRALYAAEHILKEGARLVVVTFHSLEDAIVKKFMRERSGRSAGASRHLPQAEETDAPPPTFSVSSLKPVSPSDEEVENNPRARSARLRVAVRTAADPWPQSSDEGGAA